MRVIYRLVSRNTMPPKSILKKTPTPTPTLMAKEALPANDIKTDEIEVLDEVVSIEEQDGGGDVVGSKKTQIKKKESIPASTSSTASISKPTLKITKKNVSITEQSEESIMEDETEAEKHKLKKEDKKEDKGKEVLVDVSKALKASKKPSKKHDITEIFNDDDVDYRYIITNYDFSKNKTLPKITKYEKALLVGKRAKQIEEGANPNVKVLPGQTSIDIAEEELRQRKMPFIIKRPLGNKFEYWKPIDMEVIMD